MNKHSNFLLKISGITIMICCVHIVCLADQLDSVTVILPPSGFGLCQGTKSETTYVVPDSDTDFPICDAGTYVQKCGNYTIGYKWIIAASELSTTDTEVHNYDLTGVPGTRSADYFTQMRGFFSGQLITQTPDSDDDTAENIKNIRNSLLNSTCNPGCTNFTCATCPNDKNVSSSFVRVKKVCYKQNIGCVTSGGPLCNQCSCPNTFTEPNLNYRSCAQYVDCHYEVTDDQEWSFHTVADCYQTEFEDDTGTFEYIQEGTQNASAQCFYGNTISVADFKRNYYGVSPIQPVSNNYYGADPLEDVGTLNNSTLVTGGGGR